MTGKKCTICQNINEVQKICSIKKFNMSQQILGAASYDYELSTRLTGVNKLIAAEGKYHPHRYKQFMRYTTRTKNNPPKQMFVCSISTENYNYQLNKGMCLSCQRRSGTDIAI